LKGFFLRSEVSFFKIRIVPTGESRNSKLEQFIGGLFIGHKYKATNEKVKF